MTLPLCGIDPGKHGGFALLRDDELYTCDMPDTPEAIWKLVQTIPLNAVVAVEQVSGYVGGVGQPGSAMFNFGQNYGMLLMALTAAGIRYELVVPTTWQRVVEVGRRMDNDTKHSWKTRLKERAQEAFPCAHLTLRTCDAALIVEYIRRGIPCLT